MLNRLGVLNHRYAQALSILAQEQKRATCKAEVRRGGWEKKGQLAWWALLIITCCVVLLMFIPLSQRIDL